MRGRVVIGQERVGNADNKGRDPKRSCERGWGREWGSRAERDERDGCRRVEGQQGCPPEARMRSGRQDRIRELSKDSAKHKQKRREEG